MVPVLVLWWHYKLSVGRAKASLTASLGQLWVPRCLTDHPAHETALNPAFQGHHLLTHPPPWAKGVTQDPPQGKGKEPVFSEHP